MVEGKLLSAAVLVSALGYFVDLYDLILFSVVRIPSLASLGVEGADSVSAGVLLLNLQSAGLIVGGFLWGVLADRHGRVRVLFASIALYSVANLANAFVTSVPQYAVLRFVAGVGLAGELGVAITLIGEVLPTHRRAYGTALVGMIGVAGGLCAGLAGRYLDWRVAYGVGGVLGLALLALRLKLAESGLYSSLAGGGVKRGDLARVLLTRSGLSRFARCVLVALPNWYIGGILLTFGPEIASERGATGPVSVATAVVFAYIGLGFGAAIASFASERFRSRKWVVYVLLVASAAVVFLFLFPRGMPPAWYYFVTFLSTLTTGYVGLMVLVTAEQFGTNVRATATTAMPNLVRGSVIPQTLAFVLLGTTLGLGFARAALIVGVAVVLVSLLALSGLRETYGRDMDFVEG